MSSSEGSNDERHSVAEDRSATNVRFQEIVDILQQPIGCSGTVRGDAERGILHYDLPDASGNAKR
jgi:hypothetical protein